MLEHMIVICFLACPDLVGLVFVASQRPEELPRCPSWLDLMRFDTVGSDKI